MIRLTLTNQTGTISDNICSSLEDEISSTCSFKVLGAEKSDLYKKGRWDGYKKLYNRSTKTYPMGLHEYVVDILNKHNIEYELVDRRDTEITGDLDIGLAPFVSIRDYQQQAVDVAVDKKRCVLQVATGGGKTVIASAIIAALKSNTIFIVHTKDLMYQTIDSFNEFLEGSVEIGQLGDGVVKIKPITVCTVQTLSKIFNIKFEKMANDDSNFKEKSISNISKVRKLLDSFEVIVWDEVHRVACDMAFNVSEKLTNPVYRIGLSASAWRDDNADVMIEASLGKVSYKLSASELIDMGYLTQPIIRVLHMEHADTHENSQYNTIYKECIVNNDDRNNVIVDTFIDMVGSNIPTMILVQHIAHGKKLKQMIEDRWDKVTFLSGSDFSDVRNRTIQQMREDSMGLIATTIADEGLDIKRLGGLILAGGGKSSTRALQRVGRVLRPYEGKDFAYVIDFYDDIKYLDRHALARMDIYRQEEKFIILKTR